MIKKYRTGDFQSIGKGVQKWSLHPNKLKTEETEKSTTLPRLEREARSQSKTLPPKLERQTGITKNDNLQTRNPTEETSWELVSKI